MPGGREMGKVESALREEITRLARKVTRSVQSRTVEDVRRLKKRVATLQTEIATLKREQAGEVSRSRMAEATKSIKDKGATTARLSPGLIQKLRKRLKISQSDMAVLLGLSTSAVGFWESGKAQPRPDMKARIVALRNLGRRDVRRVLAAKRASLPKKPAKPAAPRRKPKEGKRAKR